MAKNSHGSSGSVTGEGAKVSLKDEAHAVNQDKVTSTVAVSGSTTTRRYSDGSVQRQVWPNKQMAADYAASVREQEGNS